MKSILITGGLGFIGIHTSFQLIKEGYKVIIIDSLSNSSLLNLERLKRLSYLEDNKYLSNISFFKGDVRDINFIRKVFQESKDNGNKIDSVIHFAGLKSISESFKKPQKYWDVNVNGTINLISIMEQYQCHKIVFSSSATVYAKDEKSPLTEESKTLPENPYGETKLNVEKVLKKIYNSSLFDWQIICLRYFNPIGAHPSGFIGEDHKENPNNLFPLICEVALEKRKCLFVYGNNWKTPDGTGIRDYIHIMDLVEGHVASLKYFQKNHKKKIYEIINLGTGQGTSVLELIKIFQSVNKIKINYKFVGRRIGDKGTVYANPTKARKLLNWIGYRNLQQMCIDGWNWHKKR